MILDDLGMQKCKPMGTARDKEDENQQDDKLRKKECTQFRSCLIRLSYLAQDRVDLSESVKILARFMASPGSKAMRGLKRLARYLRGKQRCMLVYIRQSADKAKLRVYSDSDWAGDKSSRKSTSGMVVLRGRHLLKHSSTLQSVVTLSSCEAEYYAMTRGAAAGLGIVSLYRDWGIELSLEIYTDSSSAKSFVMRRGIGKQRHIQTRFLWLQERVAMKDLKVNKVGTHDNMADFLTKQLDKNKVMQFVQELGQEVRSGT